MSKIRLVITAVVVQNRPVAEVAAQCKITIRYQGKLYKLGIGRTNARTHVIVLV